MLPLASQATTTTFSPAMTALAGFVPWAECGIRQTFRCPSPALLVILADHQQPGELALRAGIRLKGDGGKSGDLGQPPLQLVEQSPVSGRLLPGANG